MKKLSMLLAIGALAFTLAACVPTKTDTSSNNSNDSANSSPTATPAPSTKPCEILTEADAKQVLGVEVKGESTESTCTYKNAVASGTNISVLIISINEGSDPKKSYESAKSIYGEIEVVSGLNVDEAVWSKSLMQLSMLKGNKWILIGATSTGLDSKEVSIAAAKLALARL